MAKLKNTLSLSRCLHHTFSKSFFVFLQLGVDSVSASWAGREGWCTFSPRVHLTNKKPRAIFQTLTSPSAWREGWWHRRMMINMVFCWKVKSIFKLKMIINCFERWGEVANLNMFQMKYISNFKLICLLWSWFTLKEKYIYGGVTELSQNISDNVVASSNHQLQEVAE